MGAVEPGAIGWLVAVAGLAVTVSRLFDWLAARQDQGQKLKLGELERIALDRNALYDAAVESAERADEENGRLRQMLARAEETIRVLRWQLWQCQTGAPPTPPPPPHHQHLEYEEVPKPQAPPAGREHLPPEDLRPPEPAQ